MSNHWYVYLSHEFGGEAPGDRGSSVANQLLCGAGTGDPRCQWYRMRISGDRHDLEAIDDYLDKYIGPEYLAAYWADSECSESPLMMHGLWAERQDVELAEEISRRWPEVTVEHSRGVVAPCLSEGELAVWKQGVAQCQNRWASPWPAADESEQFRSARSVVWYVRDGAVCRPPIVETDRNSKTSEKK